MATLQRVIKNLYRDSVSLMQFSDKLRALDGIHQASAVMATGNNISLLVEAGLLPGAVQPSPNDLLIVLEGGMSQPPARLWIRPKRCSSKNQQRPLKAVSGACPRQKETEKGTAIHPRPVQRRDILLRKEGKIPNVWESLEHTMIDLGDDLFTQGRPHPMIDFRLRNERIVQEAPDPETAVILLDIVLRWSTPALHAHR